VRCGGSWKRSYGTTYTGTKGETPDTDKVAPSEPPRQLSTLPGPGTDVGDHRVGWKVHRSYGLVGRFFVDSGFSLQPPRTPVPHDLRDLAPEIVLAGTVPRRGGVGVHPLCRARRLGKACARDQHCTECKDDSH